ncbi:NAD(P)-dependent oxidoreductase, partial [Escherichia coli]|nr:NAD(P)-dependent oxidoreductase [Escherichia coli]
MRADVTLEVLHKAATKLRFSLISELIRSNILFILYFQREWSVTLCI